MAYRIKDWNIHFESCESKKLKKMLWVRMPIKMDGDGYTYLLDHPNGAAHFGAWCAIVEIAAKQEPRGMLPSGINGMISRSLGRISRIPGKIFEEVLPRLEEIGWIEQVEENQQPPATSGKSPDVPGFSPGLPGIDKKRIEKNREEEKHTHLVEVREAAENRNDEPAQKNGVCVSLKKEPPVSQRFLEWLSTWPACADRDGACRAWCSRVTPADEEAAFACRDRYLASDQVSRGCLMEAKKFITVQADCGWSGTWISDATELDPNVARLKDIDRRIKEMDENDKRNGRQSRGITAARPARISEAASRLGIIASSNGKCH